MAHLYLVPLGTPLAPGGVVVLTGDEARHAATAARMRPGESTRIANGEGGSADAVAESVARDAVTLRVGAVRMEPEPDPRILLVQALAKGGRDELAIQAATELGVTAVAPWQAARSVTRWTGPKAEAGVARWSAIVREAGKQAMRARLPTTLPLHSTEEVAALAGRCLVLVLDPEAPHRLVDALPRSFRGELALVVGPEGGLTPEESIRLESAGATRVRLGPTVLRTSTAGPAALAALAAHLGLWP